MKVNELKNILNTQSVLIFVDGTCQRFWNVEGEYNEYVFCKDESINMWDVYGECEIQQIYADEDGFNIELI